MPDRPTSLEGLLEPFNVTTGLDNAFSSYDHLSNEDFKLNMSNNYYIQAQSKLYSTLSEEFKTHFGGEDKKISSPEEVKTVKLGVAKALRAYFTQISPSLLSSMDTIGLSEEEQFDFLIKEYDKTIGGGRVERLPTLGALVESLTSGKTSTYGFQVQLYSAQPNHVEVASNIKTNSTISQIFGTYESEPYRVAAHLMPLFDQAGYEISDKAGYLGADLRSLLKLRDKVLKPELEDLPYLRRRT